MNCQGNVRLLMTVAGCGLDTPYCLLENFQTPDVGLFGDFSDV